MVGIGSDRRRRREDIIGRQRYTNEQITRKVSEAEVALAKDQTVVLTCSTNDLDKEMMGQNGSAGCGS